MDFSEKNWHEKKYKKYEVTKYKIYKRTNEYFTVFIGIVKASNAIGEEVMV